MDLMTENSLCPLCLRGESFPRMKKAASYGGLRDSTCFDLRLALGRGRRNCRWRDRVRDVGGRTGARRDGHRLAGALFGVVLLHLQVIVAGFLAEDVVDFPSFQRLALEQLARDAVE